MASKQSERSELEELRRLDELERKARPRGGVARGIQEATMGLVTQPVGVAVAGARGLYGMATGEDPGKTVQAQEKAERSVTYEPRTQSGQATLADITGPLSIPSRIASAAGQKVMGATGSPTLGAGTDVALNMLPTLLARGARGPVEKSLSAPAAALPEGVAEATAAGYKLTPTMLGRGTIARGVEGLAGSAKMEKLASVKNQPNTNRLIAEDLGLPVGQKITVDSLENLRTREGAAYEAVKSSVKLIKPDDAFRADLQKLRGDFSNAAKEYPNQIENAKVEELIKDLDVNASPRSMVELTRSLRKKASSNLKAFDDPEKKELGFAQKNAAAALEKLIDRALTSVGKGDLVKQWQAARTNIAKSYDVQSALNETTGDISARDLARLYDRGAPMTGKMETVARFGQAFEGAARDVSSMRDKSEFGYGDLFLGGAGGIAAHMAHPGLGTLAGISAVLARPTIRHMMLSNQIPKANLGTRLSDVITAYPYKYAAPMALGGLRRAEEE